MALLLDKALFIHLPKTGGTFLRKVLSTYYPDANEDKPRGSHRTLATLKGQYDFNYTFSIVRNPISWYESVWKHCNAMVKNGQAFGKYEDHPLAILFHEYDEDFTKFIDTCIEKYPGFYSNSLKDFIGENYDEVDYVAKTETLYDDACFIMNKLDIKFNKDDVRRSPKYGRPATLEWKDGQKEVIKALEAEMINKFYKDSLYL